MSENKSGNGVLVHVEGVEKIFHRGSEDIHVLSELHLRVPAGEFLALHAFKARPALLYAPARTALEPCSPVAQR